MPRLTAMSYADIEAAGARWYEAKGRAGEDPPDDPDDDLIADPDTDDGETYGWAG